MSELKPCPQCQGSGYVSGATNSLIPLACGRCHGAGKIYETEPLKYDAQSAEIERLKADNARMREALEKIKKSDQTVHCLLCASHADKALKGEE